jgi:hypothetical protein
MNAVIRDCLSSLIRGPQQFKNMTLVPLFTLLNHGPEYLTLQEAMDKDLLSVAEVSHGRSVPQLKVVNRANLPVLLTGRRGTGRCEAKPSVEHFHSARGEFGDNHPSQLHEQGRWSYVAKFKYAAHIVGVQIAENGLNHGGNSVEIEAKFIGKAGRKEGPQAHHSYSSDQTAIWHSI